MKKQILFLCTLLCYTAAQTKIEITKDKDASDAPIEIFINDVTAAYSEVNQNYRYYEISIANQSTLPVIAHLNALPICLVPTKEYVDKHYAWFYPYQALWISAATACGIGAYVYYEPRPYYNRQHEADLIIDTLIFAYQNPKSFALATASALIALMGMGTTELWWIENDKSKKLNQIELQAQASVEKISGNASTIKYSRYYNNTDIDATQKTVSGVSSTVIALKQPLEKVSYSLETNCVNNLYHYKLTFTV